MDQDQYSMQTRISLVSVLTLLLMFSGCSSVYYSTWEAFGKQKRDLLKDTVMAARKDQVAASKEFQDALQVLREAYPLEPSKLQGAYDRLSKRYEASSDRAEELRERISKMDRIAHDLFKEWKREAKSMQNASLRERSLSQRAETQERYDAMRETLGRSERQMEPILRQFKDHVLFLKHSLNAQALGALEGEATEIERGMEDLIQSMQRSIAETDDFIKEFGA
jgi:chromosome segregation ATPase